MRKDIRFACKLLVKQKAFTAAALLTLALCIGVNTAIFTILKAVVLNPLRFPESDRLVTLFNVYPGVGVTQGSNGVPDYLDRRQLTDVFDAVALIGNGGYDVGANGSPQRVVGQYVTPSYFRVLRVFPILGRAFTDQEAEQGNDKVAIVSEGLWKELFGGDPHVLGKDIRLSGVPYRVVGVMPQGFTTPGTEVRVWVPFAFTPQQKSDDARHSNSWDMIARLRPGVTVAYAQRRIDILNRQNLDRFPKYRAILIQARFGTRVIGTRDELVGSVRPTLYLLQAAAALVLLIGCVNIASLLLVRSNVRVREIALRYSLGATRWQLARQLLMEGMALSLAGGACGVLVAAAGVRLLARLGASELPRGETLALDPGVLGFSAAIALLSGLVFAVVPVVHLFRRNLNDVFRGNERSGTAGRGALWTRSALVVAQVSLAFVLLAGAGLLTLSFARLLAVKPGFQPAHVLTAQFSLPRARYGNDAALRPFVERLLASVRAAPGVTAAGATTYLPFGSGSNSSVVSIDGRPLGPGELPPVPAWNTVDSGYFQAMGIPLLQGRVFSESDSKEAAPVTVIDEFLARKYFPKGDALGHKIRRGLESQDPMATIVGVVGSVKTGDLAEQNPVGQVYFHYRQYPSRTMHLVVRSEGDEARLGSSLRAALRQGDPELPLFDVKTMPQRLSRSMLNRRAAMVLCLVFGALALLLAAIGLYGVLAYTVTQRTREFGVRVALGATRQDVLAMVVGHGCRLAAAGLILGIGGALVLTRLMTALLYDVRPGDPRVFAVVGAGLLVVALAAALAPSLRALRIHPATALRYE